MSIASQNILQSVKLYSLVPEETTIYDSQMTLLINSAFNNIKQFGVGPVGGFVLREGSETWEDTGIEEPLLSSVADYVKLFTNLKFDPPANSFKVQLMENQLQELAWRITNDYSCND